jgi:hypothetical protein
MRAVTQDAARPLIVLRVWRRSLRWLRSYPGLLCENRRGAVVHGAISGVFPQHLTVLC